MKIRFVLPALAAACLFSAAALAQAPAGAPAGSTGTCKDGTYSNAPSKSGACSGHKGVAAWYGPAATKAAAPAAAPMKPAAPAPAAAPAKPAMAPAATAETAPPTPKAVAGGGPGMVWVNTSTKVYHCPGDRYYGKTKAGKYESEAQAKTDGYKADAGKACTK